MKHYWNTEIDESFEPKLISFDYKNIEYTLYSSSGVFSPNKADEGSLILCNVLLEYINSYIDNLSDKNSFKSLDIGAGYGLISIILANLIDDYIGDMIDISQRAIELSKRNIKKYSFENKLNIFESDKFNNVSQKYDIIFTNPPIRTGKENVHSILENSKSFLKDKGIFFAVIRKSHGAKSAIKKLEEVYGNCTILDRSKGYYIISSIKN